MRSVCGGGGSWSYGELIYYESIAARLFKEIPSIDVAVVRADFPRRTSGRDSLALSYWAFTIHREGTFSPASTVFSPSLSLSLYLHIPPSIFTILIDKSAGPSFFCSISAVAHSNASIDVLPYELRCHGACCFPIFHSANRILIYEGYTEPKPYLAVVITRK